MGQASSLSEAYTTLVGLDGEEGFGIVEETGFLFRGEDVAECVMERKSCKS